MYDSMPYDPIQGHGQRTSEVPKSALFKFSRSISSAIYNSSWQMTIDS